MYKIKSSLLLILLLFSIFTNINLVHAQLTPARDLTGVWLGSASWTDSFDYYPNPVSCSFTSDVELDLTQDGSNWYGSIRYGNVHNTESRHDPACDTVAHSPGPEIGGIVSSSSFSGTVYQGVTIQGTFTTDLMSGTIKGSNGAQKWDLVFKAERQSAPTVPPSMPTQPTTPTPQPTPPTTPTPSSVTGSLKIDSSQYYILQGHTTPVKITGKVSGNRGETVVLTLTKPDGTSEQNQAFLSNVGEFTSIFMLDKNSLVGRYEITASYYGTIFGSASFSVLSGQASTVPSTGSAHITYNWNTPGDMKTIYVTVSNDGGVTIQNLYVWAAWDASRDAGNNMVWSQYQLGPLTLHVGESRKLTFTLDTPPAGKQYRVFVSLWADNIQKVNSYGEWSTNESPTGTVTSPQNYELYQDNNYGFSIEYPDTWYHEEKAATSGTLSPVAYFAPDSQTTNAWLSVNYQKDATAFRGLSGQQVVNSLISAMTQNCQRNSFESNGFTCSNAQFKSSIGSYRSLPAYEVSSTWTKTLPDGTTLDMISIWVIIPVQNDLYAVVVRLSSQATTVYQAEMTHMLSSFNIYSVPQENVTPKTDYSNFGLQKGESISYKYSMAIQASDMVTQQTVTTSMLQSLAKQIGNITLNSIDDVQWIKYTVTNVSSTNILFNEETKIRNLETFQNQRDMKYLDGMAIPITANIGDSFDMFSSGAGASLQGIVNKITTIKIGNLDVPVFELSGSTRTVSQDGTTVTTMNATAHYDKKTGLMLDALADMNIVGAKYFKIHLQVTTIDWSGLGNPILQSGRATTATIPPM